jgi:hypothetical protein
LIKFWVDWEHLTLDSVKFPQISSNFMSCSNASNESNYRKFDWPCTKLSFPMSLMLSAITCLQSVICQCVFSLTASLPLSPPPPPCTLKMTAHQRLWRTNHPNFELPSDYLADVALLNLAIPHLPSINPLLDSPARVLTLVVKIPSYACSSLFFIISKSFTLQYVKS